jgi:acetyltransferase
LCAQIVAPYPPAGRIGIASQSGNFVSSFLNYAVQTGVGISRAVSAGNAAAVTVGDYLECYAADDATAVGLAYVEGISDGRAFYERVRSVAARKPLVLVKGGATAGGQRAAASHTGSLASDDRVFDGLCRQAGVTRAATVEEAFEAAASFATQPLPRGPRVVVMTTAGGWGVVTADAIARSELELVALPDDLKAEIDTKLPPRWSRNNPVDLAGGETRDTIPEVLEMIAGHDAVDAVIYLGLGIQSNQARLMRSGPFYPHHGLERIVDYHERQDARFAEAAAEVSDRTGKPILTATELAVADPTNAGPAAVRASGRLCYPSANRAVTALEHLWRYARFRRARGLHEQ